MGHSGKQQPLSQGDDDNANPKIIHLFCGVCVMGRHKTQMIKIGGRMLFGGAVVSTLLLQVQRGLRAAGSAFSFRKHPT